MKKISLLITGIIIKSCFNKYSSTEDNKHKIKKNFRRVQTRLHGRAESVARDQPPAAWAIRERSERPALRKETEDLYYYSAAAKILTRSFSSCSRIC